MKRGLLLIGAAAVVMLVLPAIATAQQQGSAGLVEKVLGTAFLRHDAGAKQIKLDAKSDVGRRLFPGEAVRCVRGGTLRLQLGGKVKEIIGPSSWFTIPSSGSSESDAVQRALDEYGRLGGRERGDRRPPLLFSPSDQSVALPKDFVIRWIPPKEKCAASLRIEETGGKAVWEQQNVDGAKGSLDSSSAKEALARYRGEAGLGPLFLKFADDCGDKDDLTFTLLSDEDERSLKQQLGQWDKEPGSLMPHLGRAWVFVHYGMFPEAAEEYEGALAIAPLSRELLIRTILAHRRTSNSAREQELTKRLPAGTAIP
jgi:hypothetical protein